MSALLTPDHTVAAEHLGAEVFLARFDIHIHVYQSQEAHSVTFNNGIYSPEHWTAAHLFKT